MVWRCRGDFDSLLLRYFLSARAGTGFRAFFRLVVSLVCRHSGVYHLWGSPVDRPVDRLAVPACETGRHLIRRELPSHERQNSKFPRQQMPRNIFKNSFSSIYFRIVTTSSTHCDNTSSAFRMPLPENAPPFPNAAFGQTLRISRSQCAIPPPPWVTKGITVLPLKS